MAATPTTHPRAHELPSAALRRIRESLHEIVREDQEDTQLATSVGEGIHRVVQQIDKLAGLQELFEWWQDLPM